MTATTTLMMSTETALSFGFIALPFLMLTLFILYALWPTNHADF